MPPWSGLVISGDLRVEACKGETYQPYSTGVMREPVDGMFRDSQLLNIYPTEDDIF